MKPIFLWSLTIIPLIFLFRKTPNFKKYKQPSYKSSTLNFLPEIGVATSEYQINGAENFPLSTWAEWEKSGTPHKSRSGLNYRNYPEKLIDKLKTLGVKHYRLSIEWSAIEQEKGKYDETNLQYYVSLCKTLTNEGIEPLITLHHFSDPIWFEKQGGFEKEENISYFVSFCEKVFLALQSYVTEWVTINEPAVYACEGYIFGRHPPGKKNYSLGGTVLKHLLQAHCQVYDRLKSLDTTKRSHIGLAHNILRLRPYHPYNPLELIVCHYFSHIYHSAVMDFLKTGSFHFKIPFLANIFFEEPRINEKFDFFGLQYYTDPLVSMVCSKKVFISTCYPHEKMSHMDTRISPQFLVSALEECKSFNKPIYITETGIASSEEDQKDYIEAVLKIASNSIQNGLDLQRLYFWSLIDNFEWSLGWEKRFGLFSFDLHTGESTLKPAGVMVQNLLQKKS